MVAPPARKKRPSLYECSDRQGHNGLQYVTEPERFGNTDSFLASAIGGLLQRCQRRANMRGIAERSLHAPIMITTCA